MILPSLLLAAGMAVAETPAPAPTTAEAPATTASSASSASPAAGAPADLAPLLVAVDAAYAERDQSGKLEAARQAIEAAARRDPGAYEVLWRQARQLVWEAEDPAVSDEQKSKLGKRAWELAEKAAALEPARVEGWFYAVSGMGNYSLGIGIFSALTQGIEGKFKDRLSRAEKVDASFLGGGVPTAWGRFWFKLPWPKHDARKSEQALRAALKQNPDNVRANVYLGDLLLDEGKKGEARAAWTAALAKPPGQYDGPEERRWQDVARASLAKLDGK